MATKTRGVLPPPDRDNSDVREMTPQEVGAHVVGILPDCREAVWALFAELDGQLTFSARNKDWRAIQAAKLERLCALANSLAMAVGGHT